MEKLQFKTNINCAACVAKVSPVLNENPQIQQWDVATTDPQKILTVKGEAIDSAELIALLDKIGYKAEEI